MKIEEKAKAYDEMVQRVKELHETGNFLTKQQMEIICPELAESEDEKIRKAILANYKGDYHIPVFNGVTREDCIAYLEKQKERLADNSKTLAKSERVIKAARRVLNNWLDGTDCPDVSGDFAELEYAIREYDGEEKQKENPKSADSIPADCMADAKYEDRWHKVTDSLPDNGREVLAKDKFGNTLLARYDGEGWDVSVYDDEDYRCHNGISKWREIPFEKQNEQKPDELDGKALLHVSNKSYDIGFRDGVASVKPAEWDELQAEFRSINEAFEDGKKEVVAHPKKYGLCKPAEWSEEDRLILDSIIAVVEEWEDTQSDKEKAYYGATTKSDWLKSLRPQPKQEWSEEDEEKINDISEIIEHCITIPYSGGTLTLSKEYKKELQCFIESLRPQPKVEWSEEDKEMFRVISNRIEKFDEWATEKGYPIDDPTMKQSPIAWLKSFLPQPQQNMSIGFMLYLDEHRPDGKMCLSNAECNEIEAAFKNQSWDTILKYVEKYQSHWKPSGEQMVMLRAVINDPNNAGAESCQLALKSIYEQLKKLI